jgi:hypothetical protein
MFSIGWLFELQWGAVFPDLIGASLLRYNVYAVVSGMEEKPVRVTKGKFKEIAKVSHIHHILGL